MENAILFGNGFNLLSSGTDSWASLLQGYSISGLSLNEIPPTMQYEQIFLSTKYQYSLQRYKTKENAFKHAIARKMKKYSFNSYYERLANLNVNTFLTTNYDHAFYDNKENSVIDKDLSEDIYSIHRFKRLLIFDKEIFFYPFHGDISSPKTMMLGLDQYGGALSKLNKYIKGEYVISKTENKIPKMEDRLLNPQMMVNANYGKKSSCNGLFSWIDAFFYMNIHIIGIGLDFSEIDLWWLLTHRARLIQKLGKEKVGNRIYYYCTDPISKVSYQAQKYQLLKMLDVDVVFHSNMQDLSLGVSNDIYKSIYSEQIDNLEKNLLQN